MYKKVRKIGVSYKQSDKTVICIYSLSIELPDESIEQIENKSLLYFFQTITIYILRLSGKSRRN